MSQRINYKTKKNTASHITFPAVARIDIWLLIERTLFVKSNHMTKTDEYSLIYHLYCWQLVCYNVNSWHKSIYYTKCMSLFHKKRGDCGDILRLVSTCLTSLTRVRAPVLTRSAQFWHSYPLSDKKKSIFDLYNKTVEDYLKKKKKTFS